MKNQDVKVNFGQSEASFHPLPGYQFIGHSTSLVRGTKAPKSKQDCEVIMMCGLPGTGKTSWAYKEFERYPDKYVGLRVPFSRSTVGLPPSIDLLSILCKFSVS